LSQESYGSSFLIVRGERKLLERIMIEPSFSTGSTATTPGIHFWKTGCQSTMCIIKECWSTETLAGIGQTWLQGETV
jgi:hypothetical protein